MIQNQKISLKSRILLCLFGAILLTLTAVLNGYPLIFNDTRSYVRQPAAVIQALTKHDLVREWSGAEYGSGSKDISAAETGNGARSVNNGITSNRSIYYGFLALLGYILTDFWLTVAVQSLWVSVSIYLLIACTSLNTLLTYLATIISITLLSCAGFYTGYIMPDIFAPILIMMFCALALFYTRLTTSSLCFVLLSTVFSLLAHPSHQLILITMTATYTLWIWLARVRDLSIARPVGLIALCLAVGLLGQFIFNKGLELYTGQKPLLIPHIEAHLVDMGPGSNYTKEACDTQRFVICRYKDRFPMYWEDFIGNPDPDEGVFAPASLEVKRQLSEEQISFAIAVFRYDPIGLTMGLMRDAAQQLVRFSLDDFIVDDAAQRNYDARFPAGVAQRISKSWVRRSPGDVRVISVFYTIVVIGALLFVLGYATYLWRLSFGAGASRHIARLIGFFLVGVLSNGVICGLLASPYDRFQARVIWLIVFAATLGAIDLLRRRREQYKLRSDGNVVR